MPPAQPQRRPHSPLAAFLSYLVPGLGQIYQGRIGKGVLFLVCLYGLFFYGQALGNWENVYLPDTSKVAPPIEWLDSFGLGRIGADIYNRIYFVGQFWIGAAAWPALWQYAHYDETQQANPPLRGIQRAPSEEEVNRLQRDGDKTWDLGWVYTVIAGVLNILVIYDAFAGAALAEVEARSSEEAPA
jgi:hypothetical protein